MTARGRQRPKPPAPPPPSDGPVPAEDAPWQAPQADAWASVYVPSFPVAFRVHVRLLPRAASGSASPCPHPTPVPRPVPARVGGVQPRARLRRGVQLLRAAAPLAVRLRPPGLASLVVLNAPLNLGQTWEYAPQYAIRSYAYVVLHGLLAWPAMLLYPSKGMVFVFVRILYVRVLADRAVSTPAASNGHAGSHPGLPLPRLCSTRLS